MGRSLEVSTHPRLNHYRSTTRRHSMAIAQISPMNGDDSTSSFQVQRVWCIEKEMCEKGVLPNL